MVTVTAVMTLMLSSISAYALQHSRRVSSPFTASLRCQLSSRRMDRSLTFFVSQFQRANLKILPQSKTFFTFKRPRLLCSSQTDVDMESGEARSHAKFAEEIFTAENHWDRTELGKSWRKVNWADLTKDHSTKGLEHNKASPVEVVMVKSRRIYVKRDDLLRLPGSNVSGNKARKLLSLVTLIPPDEFPSAVVSYGGPQSNAMVALAAVVNHQNTLHPHKNSKKRFLYYTKTIPRWLRKQPSGNLLRAKSLGMEMIELTPSQYQEMFGGPNGGSMEPPPQLEPPIDGDSIWVPQGAASNMSQLGVQQLAQEIVQYWSNQNLSHTPLAVVIPSGTGTVAFFLHLEIKRLISQYEPNLDIVVVSVPVVGDANYTIRQMKSLHEVTDDDGSLPYLIEPLYKKAFGEPSLDILNTFRYLQNECGMFVDLLYGAPAWTTLLESQNWSNRESPLANRQLIYINCGGLEGVASQLTRYKHKGMIEPNESQ